ncbi:hypothetical protein [Pseudozobellia sp. WGM2]|uniref:hypothetical protein n=1 Tax=Pseudozobellia sp. WGM2 TaxID=2787625 RepID=UPI001ADF18DC|nr:hypothetical protein [Pseudozobellia sp. WGM2]
MKVLFIISVLKQGRGGHYHSLNHISREVGSRESVGILSLGTSKSDILINNPYFKGHIHFNGLNIWYLKKELSSVLLELKPDIIHFFDSNAYNICKLFVKKKFKLVTNLCGGPNPADHPKVENLVLFSKENLMWFESREKYKNTLKMLIPNRSSKITVHSEADISKDASKFCLVRIARISHFHFNSIKQTVNLVKLLNKQEFKIRLYLIGTIQDQDALVKLFELIEGRTDITLLTDDRYTKEASKMLYLADAVIATGRGIMEGASLGLPVLTPAKNSEIPILINDENFENFFSTNFSERNVASAKDLRDNLYNIKRLTEDHAYYDDMYNFSLQLFKNNFDVKEALLKYTEMYKLSLENTYSVSIFSDVYLKIRSLYHFYLS